ncbi:Hypothetical protein SRAE_2000133900 [Strongyloides ratti]|uniref:Uncharacterized protein n=1 Tax=Strongyloides ratti TaxID=34506 RepID=A0A090LAB1_STRRB|nr:Hypothetical protein SRAE_2000133900 [Strongyloides ratti]CEF66672.1 Hypothetical protein SRAE_2000133900 [Strongyloides ratti]
MVKNTIILIFLLKLFILLAKGNEEDKQNKFISPLTIKKHFKTVINVPIFTYLVNKTIQDRVYHLYNTKGVKYFSNLKLPIEIINLGEILKSSSFEFFIITKLEALENVNISMEEKMAICNDIREAVMYAKRIMNSNEYKESIQYFKDGEKEFSELDFIYMENVLGLDVMYNIASNMHMKYPRELYLLCGESIDEKDICKSTFDYLEKF